MNDSAYQKSKSPSSSIEEVSSGLIIATVLAFFVSSALAYLLFKFVMGGSTIASLGYIFIQSLLIPCLIVGVFQLFESFRNSRSCIKIFLITSIVLIVMILVLVGIFVLSFK